MLWNNRRQEDIKSVIRKAEALLEVAAFAVLYGFTWGYFYRDLNTFPIYYRGVFVVIGLYVFLCILIIAKTDGFKFGNRRVLDLIIAQTVSMGIVNFITYVQLCLMSAAIVPIREILILYGVQILLAIFFCNLYNFLYRRVQTPWNMIMIYGGDYAFDLKEKLDTRTDKYNITEAISVADGYDKITAEISSGRFGAVMIADVEGSLRNDILKFCYRYNIRTYLVPKISDIIVRGGRTIDLFDSPLLMVQTGGLTLEQRFAKRIIDIVFSILALVPGLPIMLGVAIAIKINDGGSIFYTQERLTRGLKKFKMIKFRSMVEDAERNGQPQLAKENDDRITRVGRVIRATRLDELPQIFNILKGDMSIVGPRPEREEILKDYMENIPEFRFRNKVKAGLTGYAQIYGKYNTTPYDKLRMDLVYIENYSMALDFKLIFMTFQVLFSKESTEGFSK